ncbi:DUF234 domain-containing protein [Arcobacter porcinus]|uniref:DUF234 domain-containing protein n=1 Tax=Arcobacter porcinus TaxID=1935204 RepID=A0A5C2HDA1_9BACT|nr:DUF234 domain-containing protein [Arcobacter porcinus]OCL86459.1 Archaea bacterial proteins of unknown function [Aliarcobacter thereius]QEP40777.1 DUF234 domain-containing protein [Arcobacter porcinus]
MIIVNKTIKEQFILFCEKNNISDMKKAIEYFTIFGGLDINIDTNKDILELIEKHILNNYKSIKSDINYLVGGYSVDSAILSGIALGDRKETNAFKRAFVSFEEGSKSVESLYDKGIIDIDSSANYILKKRNNSKISRKLLFTNPFIRFWFAFVSPIYKGIKDGNYEEFKIKFKNRESDFSDFIFEELALSYIKNCFIEEKIKDHGQYWNEKVNIPIIARTQSDMLVTGIVKNTSNKIKKSDLNKFIEDCKEEEINPDIIVIFSKNGFTSEIKALKNNSLKLFDIKSLKALLNINQF